MFEQANDHAELWRRVTEEFVLGRHSIHGPDHWRRVEQNGLRIAKQNGAIKDVVRLFAVLHDSRRANDGGDIAHGERAAAYAGTLRGILFDLPDDHFELLQYACKRHTYGELSNDPTVGACWDADRLDLVRIGTRPRAAYMSTEAGCAIVRIWLG